MANAQQALVAVQQFLDQVEGTAGATDSAIVDYVAGCAVAVAEGEEQTLSDLDEVLTSASAAFAVLPEEQRLPLLMTLVQKVASVVPEVDNTPPEPMQHTSRSASIAGKTCVAAVSKIDSSDSMHEHASEDMHGEQEQAAIDTLAELCSNSVSRAFLAYLLAIHGGPEGAADWMLEQGDLREQEQLWCEKLRRLQEQQDEEKVAWERTRQQILQKFDLQQVPERDPSKKAAVKHVEAWAAKDKPQQPKVRYLEGQVVSSKGEKYILQSSKGDWDGGSRGKVYTKGKRGKGFI